MKIDKKGWDKAFKKYGKIFVKPQENIPHLAKKWKKEGIKRILDLGCGSGRHLVYLAKRGFEVYGIDISKHGIRIAKDWLRKEGLKARLKVGDIYKRLPYPDNFFDAIICIRTLNHGKINWIRKTIKEMFRILKSGGWAFVTVHKHKSKKQIPKDRLYGIRWIAPRTYIILGGLEKGVPHYRFNKKILMQEFKRVGFKIEDFWIDSENYYCLLIRKV